MAVNPLYNVLQGNLPTGPQNGIIGQFQRFKSMFKGDAKQQIQQMLNSGQITQQQYNQAVQLANQFQQMLKGF